MNFGKKQPKIREISENFEVVSIDRLAMAKTFLEFWNSLREVLGNPQGIHF